MSVSNKAIAMYGIYFSKVSDAELFVKKYYPEVKDLEDMPTKARAEIINYFSGEGVIVGYHVNIGETLEKYEQLWQKEFSNSQEKPTTHLEVVSY